MVKEMVCGLVGGLGLFLLAMGLMSEGLRAVTGRRLTSILESMAKKAIVAFPVDAGITTPVQSSSAITVMVISFINAGLLSLKQAICVIGGTNIGLCMLPLKGDQVRRRGRRHRSVERHWI